MLLEDKFTWKLRDPVSGTFVDSSSASPEVQFTARLPDIFPPRAVWWYFFFYTEVVALKPG